ncbi:MULTISPECIES: rhodanese-like domain-containing protein [unclassified Shewanella]|uniref:rhodanese-like domain-containing protein n=1 Tax=unclassified Shewanella TaxID=196818 RepID=UPI0006E5E4CD|nr:MULTISPECIES: rhodanese-like domain-containing protein [unclassified Shewanella]KPZ68002.1 Thiosulfate sulfurtransferase PspE precursor [Shewanella sp. P1-14-1]
MQQHPTRFLNQVALLLFAGLALVLSTVSIADEMPPAVAWDKINNGAMIIDVRTEQEFAAGHLDGAINIPFELVLKQLTKQKLDKDTAIVLYCRSGRRSGIANNDLVEAGFTQTYNGGGFEQLIAHQ